MAEPRYTDVDGVTACEDCGVAVARREAHTRFHSILSGHAWALAVLKTTHIGADVHGRYDAVERIDSKRFGSWSADALAEVTGADVDVEAEAMALPAGVLAAAEAIESSVTFRRHFTPAKPLGRLHPAAAEFARLALDVSHG